MTGSASLTFTASLALLALTLQPARAITISGTYYEDTTDASCPSTTSSCVLYFAALPSSTTGQLLTVNEIGCYTYFGLPFAGGTLEITDAGSNPRRPHYVEGSRYSGVSFVQRPLNYKIAGGPPRQLRFTVLATTNTTFYAKCTIVGTLSAQ